MRVKIFLGTVLLLILNTVALYAQSIGYPCGGVDPDATCPLDTWVVVLAAAAVIFAVIHLSRKQKSLLSKTGGIK